MSNNPRYVRTGTTGETDVNADLTALGDAVDVLLTADYDMIEPGGGYPLRPSFTGTQPPETAHTIPSGSTLRLLKCEADALVAAGGAVYA
jgi:hypothetical protein